MYKTSSIEQVTKYNGNFEGRSIINLDELPTYGSNYSDIADILKDLITEPVFTCRRMYSQPYEQKNTFNIIITSNNEAVRISQSNKERYLIAKINECKSGDYAYFKKLNGILKKTEIQKLFYDDMIKRANSDNCKEWNEDIKPDSEVMAEKIQDSLPRPIKYIKEHYVLKGIDLCVSTNDFFQDYQRITGDKMSKTKINRDLQKIDITAVKKRQGDMTAYFYIKSHKDLLDVFNKNNFINHTFENVNINDNQPNNTEKDTIDELTEQNKKLIEEIERLKKLLDDKQQSTDKPKVKKTIKVSINRINGNTLTKIRNSQKDKEQDNNDKEQDDNNDEEDVLECPYL
jgi:hypothetical protein